MIKDLMRVAYNVAQNSPDPSTQNGAVLVRDGEILTTGFNTFCFGVRSRLVDKYHFIEHSERMAIYNAARQGIATDGATMVCPWAACAECSRAIIQAGVKELIVHKELMYLGHWAESTAVGRLMFSEAGIKVTEWSGKIDNLSVRHNGKNWTP